MRIDEVELPEGDARLLARAFPEGLPPKQHGLFDDASPLRSLSRENAVLMGGGCALLLEVAHPLVAAGVARHSAFERDPLGRLQRTLAAISEIVFGSCEVALAAARRVDRAHRSVAGLLGDEIGRFDSQDRYSGRAVDLVLWVWATLAWTTLRVHERILVPVAPLDRERFHADHARVARLLGVPEDRVPATSDDFDRYFARVLRDDLAVGPEGRRIADALFALTARQGGAMGVPGAGLVLSLSTSLLPAELREPFGLEWSSRDEDRLERFVDSVRRLRRR